MATINSNNIKRDWIRISLFAQIALVVYFQIIVWFPLGEWNHQQGFSPLVLQAANGQLQIGDIALALAFTLPVFFFYLAYRKQYVWLIWMCLIGYCIWLVLQFKTWWLAYIFGASDSWYKIYRRVFSESTNLLPSFGRHLAPDAMHLVLQLLLLLVVFSLSIGVIQRRHNKK